MLTKFGKRRIIKYALDELSIEKPKQWDGRWRMIIYDVDEKRKNYETFSTSAYSAGISQVTRKRLGISIFM